jgi:hypothetical protein
MRHATDATLDAHEPLLAAIRKLPGLVERKRGVWYRSSRAFLHFHEDPAGLFADVRLAGDFVRLRAQTQAERRELLRRIRAVLGA